MYAFRDDVDPPRHAWRSDITCLLCTVQSELFDEFMQLKFGSFKRYGLDGSEVFLVAVQSCLARAGYHSVDDVVIGMPHRGERSTATLICSL